MQRVPDDRHQRDDDEQGCEWADAKGLRDDEREESGEHNEIAVRDVDEAHDAEDERKAGGEEGVKPADENALHDGIHPLHRHTPK